MLSCRLSKRWRLSPKPLRTSSWILYGTSPRQRASRYPPAPSWTCRMLPLRTCNNRPNIKGTAIVHMPKWRTILHVSDKYQATLSVMLECFNYAFSSQLVKSFVTVARVAGCTPSSFHVYNGEGKYPWWHFRLKVTHWLSHQVQTLNKLHWLTILRWPPTTAAGRRTQ